jgi:hypothetical protein
MLLRYVEYYYCNYSTVCIDTYPILLSVFLFCEDIDLFYTTVRFGATREVATLSNGSLARSRIINARRSDDAQLMIRMKFGIDCTSSQQTQLFHKALEKFILDRPQEFHNTLGFRLNRVEADLGYFEYMIIVQCRSSWQKIRSVLDSRAKITSYCLELQKQLKMRYTSPPMPIRLNLNELDGATVNNIIDSNKQKGEMFTKSNNTQSQMRGSVHRDSDLVFSMKSSPENVIDDTNIEHILSESIMTERKKDR